MDLILDDDGDILIQNDDVVIESRPAQWIYLRWQTRKGTHFYHNWYGNPFRFVGATNTAESQAEAVSAIEDMMRQETRIGSSAIELIPRIGYMVVKLNIDNQEMELRLDGINL